MFAAVILPSPAIQRRGKMSKEVDYIPWINEFRKEIREHWKNPKIRFYPRDRDYDNLGRIKQLLTQKRGVTKKQVYDFVDKEQKECKYSNLESYEAKGFIIEFLEKVLHMKVKEE